MVCDEVAHCCNRVLSGEGGCHMTTAFCFGVVVCCVLKVTVLIAHKTDRQFCKYGQFFSIYKTVHVRSLVLRGILPKILGKTAVHTCFSFSF